MGFIMQFSIAAVCLILAIVTNRFFKDHVVERPAFSQRKLFWIILVYILAFSVVLYWSFLALKGVPSNKLAGSWQDYLPQLGLISVILIIQLGVEKVKPSSFGFSMPKNWWVLIPPFIFFFGASLMNISSYKKTRSLYPLILFHWIGNNYHIHLYYTIKGLL